MFGGGFFHAEKEQWITASFLQAFARRQVRQQRGLRRRELLRQRQAQQQVLRRQGLLGQQQVRVLLREQVQVLLLFCRKRSGRQQRPTGQRSTGSCSW